MMEENVYDCRIHTLKYSGLTNHSISDLVTSQKGLVNIWIMYINIHCEGRERVRMLSKKGNEGLEMIS